MSSQPTPAPEPTIVRALTALVLGTLLVGAALAGRAVAGPPSEPNMLPAPACPELLSEALPSTWPSSTYLVPWGPVTGRVCGYPGAAAAPPEAAGLRASGTLDPSAVARFAGLVQDLPPPAARCLAAAPAAAGPETGVVVVLLRFRPGATPTVGEEMRLVVRRSGPCTTVSNGLRTVELDDATRARLQELAPAVRQLFPSR